MAFNPWVDSAPYAHGYDDVRVRYDNARVQSVTHTRAVARHTRAERETRG
jgi:hypothetical protein